MIIPYILGTIKHVPNHQPGNQSIDLEPTTNHQPYMTGNNLTWFLVPVKCRKKKLQGYDMGYDMQQNMGVV